MKRKYENTKKILSVMPAPGWKAYLTCLEGDVFSHDETPMIGFATVRRMSRLEGSDKWFLQADEDDVEPLLWFWEDKVAYPLSSYEEYPLCDNEYVTVVPPGDLFDESGACERLKNKIASKNRIKALLQEAPHEK
ncbi:MAG: hypothetical protein WBM24_08590 [Candidatus Sulfotelmatobacter sp.]